MKWAHPKNNWWITQTVECVHVALTEMFVIARWTGIKCQIWTIQTIYMMCHVKLAQAVATTTSKQ